MDPTTRMLSRIDQELSYPHWTEEQKYMLRTFKKWLIKEMDAPPPDHLQDLAGQVVAVLSRALSADPEAISALVGVRVPCNEIMADDPTIQVGRINDQTTLGVMGVLNGIVGKDENGNALLLAHVNGDGRVVSFAVRPR